MLEVDLGVDPVTWIEPNSGRSHVPIHQGAGMGADLGAGLSHSLT